MKRAKPIRLPKLDFTVSRAQRYGKCVRCWIAEPYVILLTRGACGVKSIPDKYHPLVRDAGGLTHLATAIEVRSKRKAEECCRRHAAGLPAIKPPAVKTKKPKSKAS
jgi:hypothetical protein